MTRSCTQLLGVDTVADYLALCEEAVKELRDQQDSVLKGFMAILALNHVPDWLRYKLNEHQRQTLGLATQPKDAQVVDFFEGKNGDLKLVREIANGFKHLGPVHSTKRVAGYGRGPFGVCPLGEAPLSGAVMIPCA